MRRGIVTATGGDIQRNLANEQPDGESLGAPQGEVIGGKAAVTLERSGRGK